MTQQNSSRYFALTLQVMQSSEVSIFSRAMGEGCLRAWGSWFPRYSLLWKVCLRNETLRGDSNCCTTIDGRPFGRPSILVFYLHSQVLRCGVQFLNVELVHLEKMKHRHRVPYRHLVISTGTSECFWENLKGGEFPGNRQEGDVTTQKMNDTVLILFHILWKVRIV